MNHRISRELHRLNVRIGRELEKCCPCREMKEITGTNGRIIHFLSEHEREVMYQKDLERAFGITRSTASRVLGLMEEKGLVERSGVTHDARLKRVTLTERSRGYSQAMRGVFEKMDEKLFEGFSEEERAQLMQYLERMQANLEG